MIRRVWNVAFRFGVNRNDKIRAFGDFGFPNTNRACAVITPIKWAPWGQIAEMCRSIRDKSRAWGFFKADRASAYKQLPICPNHAKYADAAWRSPKDGGWYGPIPNSLMSGSIVSVIRYNVFSRTLREIVSRVFGIPLISYFVAFGALYPLSSQGALEIFQQFCEITGIEIKAGNQNGAA